MSGSKDNIASPKKRFSRIASKIMLCLIALLTAGGIWAYMQYNTVPQYWLDNQQYLSETNTETLAQNAASLEKSFTNKLSNPNNLSADSSRMVRIPTSLINAWLDQRLPLWITQYHGYEMPENLHGLMLTTEGDNIVIAFELDDGNTKQVISTIFHIAFNDNGTATLKLVGLRAGSLPLPVSASLAQLGEIENVTGPGQAVEIASLDKGITFTPTIQLDKSRNAEIIGLQTEPASDSHPEAIIVHIKQSPRNSGSLRHASSSNLFSALLN